MSISLTFSERREFSMYTATDRNLTVYCGDVLKFLPSVAGQFDAIWDRNAQPARHKGAMEHDPDTF